MSIFDNDDTLLARWLEGTLDENERKALEAHPDFPEFQRIVAAADRLKAPDAATDKAWTTINHELQPSNKTSRKRRNWMYYSAAAAIALLIAFIWWPQPNKELWVQTGIGEQKTVKLPDGSSVRLNAVSEIRANIGQWSKVRQVNLKGEVFFDVVNNPKVPFRAVSGNHKITVLGTTFAVLTRDSFFEISCYTGLVKAESNGLSTEIPAGRKLATTGNGNWLNHEVNEGDTPPWMRGEINFYDAPLSQVINELERHYAITFDNKTNKNPKFTGELPNNNLPLALDILSKALQLKYQINGKIVLLELS